MAKIKLWQLDSFLRAVKSGRIHLFDFKSYKKRKGW